MVPWLVLGGIALLSLGAELVVRGAVKLAAALHVRPLVIGLTVVAIGTSAPELVVGITASLEGRGQIAVANIAGTNMVNILLILGMSALALPMPLHLQVLRLDLPAMVVASIVLTLLALDGVLTWLDGLALLAVAVVYTALLVRWTRGEARAVKAEFAEQYGRLRSRDAGASALLLLAGVAVTVIGGDLLVRGAVGAARSLGVSDAIIGLTVVAIGTSAPEIVIAVIATIRRERDVAVGNLIGSSVYNLVVILGLTCLVPPDGVPVDRDVLALDLPLVIAVAAICIPVFVSGRRVSRVEGALFVASYVAYLVWIVTVRA